MAPPALTELKEGSHAPLRMNDVETDFGASNGVGVSDGDGVVDGDGVSDGDGVVDGDGVSDGELADAPRRSSRQRSAPDRLTYQQLGGVACHLAYAFISKPTTILSAFYQKISSTQLRHVLRHHRRRTSICIDDASK